MENWLKTRLSSCLNFDVPDEMISYILSLKDSTKIDDHFETLLNLELNEHQLFLNEFKQKILRKNGGNNKTMKQNKTDKSVKQKSPVNDEPIEKQNSQLKKKSKYVNLYQKDYSILLKGRHPCNCQASKHKLINNCLKCGRIVCEQEGSGLCLFCGNLVCSEEETKLIESSTKKGDNLKKSLMEQGRPKGWEEAMAQRNRLLEYDRTSEKRTTIIDDESDYFKTNSVWLSDTERKKLEKLENEMREKKHSSRLNRTVAIDFAGRQVIDEPVINEDYEKQLMKDISNTANPDFVQFKLIYDPNSEIYPIPKFDETKNPITTNNKINMNDKSCSKVQDKEYLEISDMRNCLSMHQPWASLLIRGIKKHEGRTWFSSHRGRLWIASTAKEVNMDDVKRMEQFYKQHYKNENIEFPTQYPSGCLLGCVLVQDCLQQEEYRKLHPNGESDSPYVFICSDFQELSIKFPIKGQHKIYKLDQNIHQAAANALRWHANQE